MHAKKEPLSQPRACQGWLWTEPQSFLLTKPHFYSLVLASHLLAPQEACGLWPLISFQNVFAVWLNLAGEMRPRISKGVIQAGLFHGGHDRNPLGRKNQMLGRKEANRSFPSEIAFSSAAAAAKSLQSCLTLCDPRDGSPPGSPVPGILQARTLEWVAISFSDRYYIVLIFLLSVSSPVPGVM